MSCPADDVTTPLQRNTASLELEAGEFRLLFESLPGLLIVLLPDAPRFTIAAANDAYLAATLTQRNIIGRGLFEVFPDNPNDPAADGVRNLKASLETVLATRCVHRMALQKYDVEKPDRSGFEEKWWSPTNSPLLVGSELRYIIHQVEDVTAEVLLQRESARQESLFTAVVEALPSGVLVSDLNGRILVNNPAAQAITRLATADIPQEPSDWPACFGARTPEGRLLTAEEAPLGRALRGETIKLQEMQFRNQRNGEGVHVAVAARPLLDAQGVQIGAMEVFTDISERVASEQALAESEARYRQLADNNPALIFRCYNRPGWPMIYMSKAVEKITGFPAADFTEGRRLWGDLLLPESAGALAAEVAEQASARGLVVVQYPIRHADGSVRWLEGNAQLVTLPDGSEGYEGAITDITERQRITQALAESEARYKELADNSPAMIIRCRDEPGWPVLYASRAAEQICGYSAVELVQQPLLWGQLMLPEDAQAVAQAVQQQLAIGRQIKVEYRIRHRDGSVRWIAGSARLAPFDSGEIGFEGVNIDITARKSAEQELASRADALQRAQIATNAARIASFTWFVERDLVETDPLGETLHCLPAATTLRTLKEFLSRVHPDDLPTLQEGLQTLRQSGAPTFQFEYRTVSENGRVRWIRAAGTLTTTEGVLRAIGAVSDATIEVEIQRALEDRTREMERANAELDEFTYIASHDLKEPLRGIHNYARFITEDYGEKLDAGGLHMLKAVSEQADRMQRLIEDLLEIARLGREPMKQADTDLDALVDEVLASLQFSLAEKKVEVRKLALGRMICDRVRVGEVFRNLITNALKYNDKPVPRIEIGSRAAPSGEREFYVQDNGIGIKADFHARVFAPFKRLHAKDAYGGGSGVGLAIVKRIVEAHGGVIGVSSTPGEGATFTFTLSGEHFT